MTRRPETDGLERQLRAVAAARRRQFICEGFLKFAAAGFAGLMLLFALDWLTRLPYAMRLLLLLGLGAAVVWRLRVFLRRHAGAVLSPEGVSLLLEERHPEIQSRLISTLQFQGGQAPAQGVSENLVEGLVDETFALLPSLNLKEAVEPRARRGAPPLLAALLLMGGAVVLCPAQLRAFLLRLVSPSAAYPTRTRIAEVTLPPLIIAGESAPVRVRATGELPVSGLLELKSGSGLEIPLVASTPAGTYMAELPPLIAPTRLRVLLGDDSHGPVEVLPHHRPTLQALRIVVKPPAYTGKAEQTLESGHVLAMKNSGLAFAFTASVPLQLMKVLDAETRAEFLPLASEDGMTWTGALQLMDSRSYLVTLVDRSGIASKGDAVYRLVAVEDQPPVIRVERPDRSVELAPASRLPLEFAVSDDIGLKVVRLLYRIEEAASEAAPAAAPGPPPAGKVVHEEPATGTAFRFKWLWNNAELPIAPGQTLILWVEAGDNALPEPNVARSEPLRIPILSPEKLAEMYWSRLQGLMGGTDAPLLRLKGSQRVLNKLTEKKEP